MTCNSTTYSDDFVLFLIVLHDGQGLLHEGSESFLDALNVVVGTAAGLASLQQSLLHHLFGAIEEQQEWNLDLVAQLQCNQLELHRVYIEGTYLFVEG